MGSSGFLSDRLRRRLHDDSIPSEIVERLDDCDFSDGRCAHASSWAQHNERVHVGIVLAGEHSGFEAAIDLAHRDWRDLLLAAGLAGSDWQSDVERWFSTSTASNSEIPAAAYIRVRLQMRRTEDGGRRRPIRSGLRPNCWLGHTTETGQRAYNGAAVYLEAVEELYPGEVGSARLQPFLPGFWTAVAIGSLIEICEGHRVIAEATILGAAH